MAFSYSGNPASSRRDEVRFLTGDTDSACALNSDEELDYLIAKWMPLYQSALFCAAMAAQIIANKWAGTVNVADGGASAATGELQTKYTAMAQLLLQQYQEEGDVGGVIDLANLLAGFTYDPDLEPLEFSLALGDNVRAGDQSWGGKNSNASGFAEDGIVSGP